MVNMTIFRRECLNHVIVPDESSLRRLLRSYFDYYQHLRPHLSLAKDAPEPREISPQNAGPCSECLRSAAFITATNDEPPERS